MARVYWLFSLTCIIQNVCRHKQSMHVGVSGRVVLSTADPNMRISHPVLSPVHDMVLNSCYQLQF